MPLQAMKVPKLTTKTPITARKKLTKSNTKSRFKRNTVISPKRIRYLYFHSHLQRSVKNWPEVSGLFMSEWIEQIPLFESSFSTANTRIIESDSIALFHSSSQLENFIENSLRVVEFLILYSTFQAST